MKNESQLLREIISELFLYISANYKDSEILLKLLPTQQTKIGNK